MGDGFIRLDARNPEACRGTDGCQGAGGVMFTGLIEAVGSVESIRAGAKGMRIVIHSPAVASGACNRGFCQR